MASTLIIIPAYNEAGNIEAVITSLGSTNPDWDILVVNDGSTDNTGEVAKATGRALVAELPCNLGIGGAVQTGLKYAARHNYLHAVKFDGDGQHRAEEIDSLLRSILSGSADVVIGSRFLGNGQGYQSTWVRRIGIGLFQIINSLLIGQKVTDNTSGLRAYNRKSIEFLAKHYPSFDYPEPEEIILLAKNNFVIREIPVEMRERAQGKSSISPLKSLYYVVKVVLAVLMTSLRPKIDITESPPLPLTRQSFGRGRARGKMIGGE